MNDKKQQRLTEASKHQLFNQLAQLNRLLKVYAGLPTSAVWQEITSYADNGISLQKLSENFGKPEPNVFRHVKILKDVGLVLVEQEGKFRMLFPNYDLCLRVEKFYDTITEAPGQPRETRKDVGLKIAALADTLRFLVWHSASQGIHYASSLMSVQEITEREVYAALSILDAAGWVRGEYRDHLRSRHYQAIPQPELFNAMHTCLKTT